MKIAVVALLALALTGCNDATPTRSTPTFQPTTLAAPTTTLAPTTTAAATTTAAPAAKVGAGAGAGVDVDVDRHRVVAPPKPAAPKPTPPKSAPPKPAPPKPAAPYFKNCAAAKSAGAAPLIRGVSPGYRSGLDGDGDGRACE